MNTGPDIDICNPFWKTILNRSEWCGFCWHMFVCVVHVALTGCTCNFDRWCCGGWWRWRADVKSEVVVRTLGPLQVDTTLENWHLYSTWTFPVESQMAWWNDCLDILTTLIHRELGNLQSVKENWLILVAQTLQPLVWLCLYTCTCELKTM